MITIVIRNRQRQAMAHIGDPITQFIDKFDSQFRSEQTGVICPVSAISPEVASATITGLDRIITHSRALEQHLPIYSRPQGRCGPLFIDATHKYGLYHFLDVPFVPIYIFWPATATAKCTTGTIIWVFGWNFGNRNRRTLNIGKPTRCIPVVLLRAILRPQLRGV